eukprot:231564_1
MPSLWFALITVILTGINQVNGSCCPLIGLIRRMSKTKNVTSSRTSSVVDHQDSFKSDKHLSTVTSLGTSALSWSARSSMSSTNRVISFANSFRTQHAKQNQSLSPQTRPLFTLCSSLDARVIQSTDLSNTRTHTNPLSSRCVTRSLTVNSRVTTQTSIPVLEKQIQCSFLLDNNDTFVYFDEASKLNFKDDPQLFWNTVLGRRIEINRFFRLIDALKSDMKHVKLSYLQDTNIMINYTNEIMELANSGYFDYTFPSDNTVLYDAELLKTFKKLREIIKNIEYPAKRFIFADQFIPADLSPELVDAIKYQYLTVINNDILLFSTQLSPPIK